VTDHEAEFVGGKIYLSHFTDSWSCSSCK